MNFALLHGGGQGSWVWGAVAALLEAAGARVLALDVPGCGIKRGRDVAGLTTDDIAHELIEDLRRSNMSDVVLVGHSLAGAILPLMAGTASVRFHSLVYLSCTAPLNGKSFLDQMGSGLHGETEDEVGWPVDSKLHSLEQRYRAMFCNDMRDDEAKAFISKLGRDAWPSDVFHRTNWDYNHLIGMASTYIVCERDRTLPPDWQRRFAARLHSRRTVSLDAGHQAMNTQPAAFAKLLLDEGAD